LPSNCSKIHDLRVEQFSFTRGNNLINLDNLFTQSWVSAGTVVIDAELGLYQFFV
jgi:hypothetical protein